MSQKPVTRLSIVRREEKEAKLREFVLGHVGSMQTPMETGASCLLIARSADSPVAKTVLTMGAKASLRGFAVRAIFAYLGTAETARVAEACRVSDWALQIRWARDLRLLDAHEQLVLGPSTAWIGDCMRREPASRDACELFASDCMETARRASMFFERLWQASEPIFERAGTAEIAPVQPLLGLPVEQLGAIDPAKAPSRTSV